MTLNLHPMANVAIKAARTAGSIINRAALDIESVRVSQKKANDFVTEVDKAAEQAIIETLLTAYPGHGILAEESGSEYGARDSEYVWIIDPLDGTTNFIHGLPVYCVSIALAVRGKIEQAVVYDPTRNDLFTATKGRGAYLNDRRIRVSKRTQLKESLISTGFPFRPGDNFNQYLQMMGDVMQRTALQLWTWPMWPPATPKVSSSSVCNPGTWLPAPCWSPKPVVWWATSRARLTSSSSMSVSQATRASMASWSACWASTASSHLPARRPLCAKPPSPLTTRKRQQKTLPPPALKTRPSDQPTLNSATGTGRPNR